jgi:hypothetical protein
MSAKRTKAKVNPKLTYQRVRQVLSWNPETGILRRLDGVEEPYGGYVRLRYDRYLGRTVDAGYGFNFVDVDGHRYWVHTVVDILSAWLRTGDGSCH